MSFLLIPCPLGPLFLCAHCSSVRTDPLFLCAQCSSVPTDPLFLCSQPTSPLYPQCCAYCSSVPPFHYVPPSNEVMINYFSSRYMRDNPYFFRLSQTPNKSLKLADNDSPSEILAIKAADIPIPLASTI